jgi:predicted DNA-binding protein
MRKAENNKRFKSIKIEEKSHQQLKYLSLITGKKMSNILTEIMDNITPLSVMYSKGCSIEVSHRVTESQVYITVHGYSPSFVSGRAFSEAEMKSDIEQHFEGASKQ